MKLKFGRAFAAVVAVMSLTADRLYADEDAFPSLKQMNAVYEFYDGVNVTVKASGVLDREPGAQAILLLKTLEVSLSGLTVSPKSFRKLCKKVIGIKLETIQVSRYLEGDTPKDTRAIYVLKFDYYADPFSGVSQKTWEDRKKMTVLFGKHGIEKVVEEK